MKKRETKKLPDGMTLGQMEEIFTDRLANLIVRLLDYRHEQKLSTQVDEKINNIDKNEKEAEPKI